MYKRQLIDYAETLDEEVAGAVPSVQEKFEKALAEAKTVSETVAVTQQQINDAWGELLDAIHYLDFQAGDKTELKIQLDIAAQIIEASEGLDPSSIEELKAVMEEAQKVYDNRDAMEPVSYTHLQKDSSTLHSIESAINFFGKDRHCLLYTSRCV